MVPDYEAASFWLDVAQWIVLGIATFFAWAASRDRATKSQIEDHEKRLMMIEAAMEHLPSDEEIKQLAAGVAALQGDVKAILATLDGVDKLTGVMQRQIDTMDDWLRKTSREGR